MNLVTKFMFYLYNKWSICEAKKVFGYNLGEHIWGKWIVRRDSLRWYAELDKECQQKLVDRANEIYS